MDMARVLVLANRTVDSPQLRNALADRSERGPIEVTLLVPAAWEVQDPHGGVQSGRPRMNAAVAMLRDAGLDVRVRVGGVFPVVALREVWDPARSGEVILST